MECCSNGALIRRIVLHADLCFKDVRREISCSFDLQMSIQGPAWGTCCDPSKMKAIDFEGHSAIADFDFLQRR